MTDRTHWYVVLIIATLTLLCGAAVALIPLWADVDVEMFKGGFTAGFAAILALARPLPPTQ
jgi:hypothetical protein